MAVLDLLKGGRRLKVDLHGVTKTVTIAVEHVGHEADLCSGYRRGFVGTTNFVLKDYRIDYELGPASQKVEFLLSVTGISK
jgi:polyisoprenoid-binding protein YceI